jgi:hypothetical protein
LPRWRKEDRIVADRLSHASLLEAASLSPAQLRRFAHNDPQQLAQLLATAGSAGGEKAFSAWTATARRWRPFTPQRRPPGRYCWWMTPTASAWS